MGEGDGGGDHEILSKDLIENTALPADSLPILVVRDDGAIMF